MIHHKYQLNRVDIGGGLWAVGAWVGPGPIVLIKTVDKVKGAETNSRLDLQKRVFIDPLPGERSSEGILHLIQSVISSSKDEPPQRINYSM